MELAKEVHRLTRLRIRLSDAGNHGEMILNRFNSSIIDDVKTKQDLDPTLG